MPVALKYEFQIFTRPLQYQYQVIKSSGFLKWFVFMRQIIILCP